MTAEPTVDRALVGTLLDDLEPLDPAARPMFGGQCIAFTAPTLLTHRLASVPSATLMGKAIPNLTQEQCTATAETRTEPQSERVMRERSTVRTVEVTELVRTPDRVDQVDRAV